MKQSYIMRIKLLLYKQRTEKLSNYLIQMKHFVGSVNYPYRNSIKYCVYDKIIQLYV